MSKTPWTEGPYHTAPWGDGSSAPGTLNVLSETAQTVIAKDLPEAEAKLFAAAPEMADFLLVAREYIEHTANGEMDKGVSGIAKRDLARLDEILSALRGDQ